MKYVRCWNDLRPYGIDCLMGEACGLGFGPTRAKTGA